MGSSATKAAVDAVTKSLSKELGSRNIRVNAINPGFVETEVTHAAGAVGGDFQKQVEGQIPLRTDWATSRYCTRSCLPRICRFRLDYGSNVTDQWWLLIPRLRSR
jgi:NAD(P)-dependent dehydrogenase (short-subunit alcohol dehydrogenase family)